MRHTLPLWLAPFFAVISQRQRARRQAAGYRRAGLEPLELRQMLSVSAQTLIGPVEQAGARWTYQTPTGTVMLTSEGETANGDITADVNISDGETGVEHYGIRNGEYVLFDTFFTNGIKTVTETDSPFEVAMVASVDTLATIGTMSTTTVRSTDLPGPTDSNVTVTFHLESDALQQVTVPAGTFNVYVVKVERNSTNVGEVPGDPDVTYRYYAPGVGEVEEFDASDSIDPTLALQSFTDGETLKFLQPPVDSVVDGNIPLTVKVVDSVSGAVIKNSNKTITLTLSSPISSPGALDGTVTADVVNGLATFKNLSINQTGQYIITASDGNVDTVVSDPFKVAPGKLVVVKVPKTGNVDQPLNPVVEVELQDGAGKPITLDDGSVVTLDAVGLVTPQPHVSGNTATLLNGIATFPNLKLGDVDAFDVTATDLNGDLEGVSTPFTIKGNHLVFTKAPVDTGAGAPVVFTVTVEDANNRPVTTDSTDKIRIDVLPQGAGPAADVTGIGAGPEITLVNGVAAFTVSNGFKINNIGTFALQVSEVTPGEAAVAATTGFTSKAIHIKGNHLFFKVAPAPQVGVNTLIDMVVEVLDFKGHVVPDSSDQIVLFLNPLAGSPATTPVGSVNLQLVNGIASYTSGDALGLTTLGSYSFTAKEEDLDNNILSTATVATTKSFKVMPNKLVFHIQPGPAKAILGTNTFTLWLVDFKNHIVPETTGGVTLTLVKVNSPVSTTVVSSSNIGFQDGTIPVIAGNYTAGTYEYMITQFAADDSAVSSTLGATSAHFKVT